MLFRSLTSKFGLAKYDAHLSVGDAQVGADAKNLLDMDFDDISKMRTADAKFTAGGEIESKSAVCPELPGEASSSADSSGADEDPTKDMNHFEKAMHQSHQEITDMHQNGQMRDPTDPHHLATQHDGPRVGKMPGMPDVFGDGAATNAKGKHNANFIKSGAAREAAMKEFGLNGDALAGGGMMGGGKRGGMGGPGGPGGPGGNKPKNAAVPKLPDPLAPYMRSNKQPRKYKDPTTADFSRKNGNQQNGNQDQGGNNDRPSPFGHTRAFGQHPNTRNHKKINNYNQMHG